MKKNVITVNTLELWSDVMAYGTYECGKADEEIWSYNGKLYRLCFGELPLNVKKEILETYEG